MNLIVRKYQKDDYMDVDRIINNAFGYHKSKTSDSRAHEFVGIYEEKIVGYFVLNEIIDVVKNIKIFHVDYVCVDENMRGLGIGKELMKYAIKYATDNGISRMELTSSSKRKAAHQLYLGMGFVIRDSSVFRKELL